MKKTTTVRDLRKFRKINQGLQREMRRAAQTTAAAAATVYAGAQAGREDAAIAFGMAAMSALASRRDDLLRAFEQQALRCFGERRLPGETVADYAARIFELLDDPGPIALAARNGVTLVA